MSKFGKSKYHIAAVQHRNGYNTKKYSFAIHNDDVVKISEFPTPLGITDKDEVVDIIGIVSFDDAEKSNAVQLPKRELKGVVDETSYLNRVKRRKEKEEIKKQMDIRIKELKDQEIYKMFAAKDESIRTLLEQYEAID